MGTIIKVLSADVIRLQQSIEIIYLQNHLWAKIEEGLFAGEDKNLSKR